MRKVHRLGQHPLGYPLQSDSLTACGRNAAHVEVAPSMAEWNSAVGHQRSCLACDGFAYRNWQTGRFMTAGSVIAIVFGACQARPAPTDGIEAEVPATATSTTSPDPHIRR